MKFYTFPPSPNCRKILATMHHLGLDAETEVIDLTKGESDTAKFLAINPHGRVPAFEDGELKLWESNTIMRYLAEKKGACDLFPADARARAEISRWMDWQLAHLGSAGGTLIFENMLKPFFKLGPTDAAAVKAAEEEFSEYAAALEAWLSSRQWLAGAKPTLADFSVGSVFDYAGMAKFPMAGLPHIGSWLARLGDLPAWKATAPQMGS